MASGSAILAQQVEDLRVELKQWEDAFAQQHGRKAGRDDIASDAFVKNKYRDYHRLKRPIEKAIVQAETPRRERQVKQLGSGRKRGALRERAGNGNEAATPHRVFKSLEVVQEEQDAEPTPAFIRCGLGPTPQKDGQVLGIFDMAVSGTPSKSGETAAAQIITNTPSKPTPMAPPSSNKRLRSATPQSSSKRRLLDAFAGTPPKRKRQEGQEGGQTPGTAKRHYATPSFLRRSFPLAPVDEETVGVVPQPRKRGLVRSLSDMIQGLKRNEEKKMDDEWDILNELEAEAECQGENGGETWEKQVRAVKAQARVPKAREKGKVLVEDSQTALAEGEMPLGPDQGAPGSEDEDHGGGEVVLGRDGKPRKPWKKKGLKRQTKRTNMKPVLHAAKKAGDLEAVEEADDDEDEVVAETQQAEAVVVEEDERAAKRRKALAGEAIKSADVTNDKGPKKVKADKHANFRALKIKNKNAKGKGGGKRFGRR